MSTHAAHHARWLAHANGVNPPRLMRDWLVDPTSLTMKLSARCTEFRVHLLHQGRALCVADQFSAVQLPRRRCVQAREVLLQCDGRSMVYAQTIVPLQASAADWPFFGTLGERSLGSTLFGDPRVLRGALQFARLRRSHPLMRRACAVLESTLPDHFLFARRCLYRRRRGILLVTELFLPAIAELGHPHPRPSLSNQP